MHGARNLAIPYPSTGPDGRPVVHEGRETSADRGRAAGPGGTLLAGDAVLRRVAEGNGADCHGLLWLLDELESAGVGARVLRDGLRAIAEHPRCRLPRTEVKVRLRGYAGRTAGR